ncbi:hypothetical protein [Kosakonia sacchari]|uniref:Uncharacterized protein n=1 Tax=Kosakonia sacchari TaxID=1158459 RepID=A0ABZ0MSI1_9ENTR|nr:hypothetical protein [Kosakonia sacchari]WOZ77715.1 hypothetical protein Q8Y70_01185 [Kosakonia sacchari]
MIEVASYIKHKKKFINIFEFEGVIDDPNYIEGGLILNVNGVELINLEMWDYIDQLWAYISTGLNLAAEDKEFETNFPDQPIKMKFKPIRQELLLSVDCHTNTKVIVEKNAFVNDMSKYALAFFGRLSNLKGVDKNNYDYEIKMLKNLID